MNRIIIICFVVLLFLVNDVQACIKPESIQQELPENNKNGIRRKWNGLFPKQTKLQYAGSMGMFSASLGWYYGKKKQWETDVFLGYIPPDQRLDGHVTFTLKQTFTPWRVELNERLFLEPLTSGLYINKIFGEYFWSDLPEKYPKNYYFWALDTRFNIFLGQALSLRMNDYVESGKSFAFFYELSTNDLYVISAIGNKTVTVKNIIGLSVGLRYRFF